MPALLGDVLLVAIVVFGIMAAVQLLLHLVGLSLLLVYVVRCRGDL